MYSSFMREKTTESRELIQKKFSIEFSETRRDVVENSMEDMIGLTSFLGSRTACRMVVCQLNL